MLKPALLVERRNDLQNFFWPSAYFIKDQLIKTQEIPLWNNLYLSGTPLLPDPQSMYFYLPNIILWITPLDLAFIVSVIAHIFAAGVGMYLLFKHGFKFEDRYSLLAGILYITSPKLMGYIDAGHYGLILSYTWLPFLLLATTKMAQKPKMSWVLLFAISLAQIFYTHSVTFLIAAASAFTFYVLYLLFTRIRKNLLKNLVYLGIGYLLTFGLVAVALLPQLSWRSQTTRFLLLETKDLYPKWLTFKEIITALFAPWMPGKDFLWSLDSEKWVTLGILPSLLALVGFFYLRNIQKVIFFSSFIVILSIAINNLSPIQKMLISFDWLVLLRVTTRFWCIPVMMVIFLTVLAIQKLSHKRLAISWVILLLMLVELISLNWVRLLQPLEYGNFKSNKIYEFLSQDKDHFRVFCINRCLSQQMSAKYGLELVEGYNTLQQTNYYKHSWQLSGGYWNYYTLAIPPIGIDAHKKLDPDPKSLGFYNTKYIISPYSLNHKDFVYFQKIEGYYIYINNLYQPRAYFKKGDNEVIEAKITKYSPNYIRVDTTNQRSNHLVLSEVYSKGWRAYLNGKEEVPVQETPESLRLINIAHETKFVEFKYQPPGYELGKLITGITLILLMGIGIKLR